MHNEHRTIYNARKGVMTMVRIMSGNDTSRPTVIKLSRGDVFYVKVAIPSDAGRYARIDQIKGDTYRMIFKKQCIAVVEDLWTPHTGADLVLFIREDRSREGVYNLWFARIRKVPGLRQALQYFNVPQVHVVTGVMDAVLYNDELLIPDNGNNSPYGWIVKRDDADRYIAALPVVRDSGERDTFHIWVETHVRPGGVRYPLIRIEGWSKAPEPFRTNATLCAVSEYVVVFDTGSRIIKLIFLTNASVESLYCDKGPLRGIEVGKRLPTNLGRGKW